MILFIGGSGLGKVNALLNRINQPDVYNKISIVINKRESVSLKYLDDTKAFIQYSNDIYDNYKNLREYQPSKKRKTLLVFDDVITTIFSNNEFNTIVL